MDRETNKEVVNDVSDKPATFTITRRISNNLVIWGKAQEGYVCWRVGFKLGVKRRIIIPLDRPLRPKKRVTLIDFMK